MGRWASCRCANAIPRIASFCVMISLGLLELRPVASVHAASPEYILNEEVVITSIRDLRLPIDGLGVVREVPRVGIFGDTAGSYLPIFEELFSEATFTFAPRSYYFHRDRGGVIEEEAAIGGTARVVTGWWQDILRLGFSTSASGALYSPKGREGAGLLRSNGSGYWTRGEGYLEARWKNVVSVRGPWRELDLPFLNIDDSRMTPQVHEGWLVFSDFHPNLRFGGGHVSGMKRRNETTFRALSDVAGVPGSDQGATLGGFRYEWREDESDIGLLSTYGWDTYHTLYFGSNHTVQLADDLELSAAAQWMKQESVGEEWLGPINTGAVGLQGALSYRGVVGSISYTSVDEDGEIRNPWGGSPLYTASMISDFDQAGMDAVRIALSSSFESIGLPWAKLSASYINGAAPDAGLTASPDQDEVNLTLDLKPTEGRFDNVWLRIRQAWNDGLGGVETENLRLILNYSHNF